MLQSLAIMFEFMIRYFQVRDQQLHPIKDVIMAITCTCSYEGIMPGKVKFTKLFISGKSSYLTHIS